MRSKKRTSSPELRADYVVVGGGTAGCVLAGRLSEAGHTVLVLEEGPSDRHPLIHLPAGFARLPARYQSRIDTVAQEHCAGRQVPLGQGRVIGGGGSVNAQVFTRGVPGDFDRWVADYGARGWGAAEVAPYFVRSEGNTRLAGPWHGSSGPLTVSDQPAPHALTEAFLRAGVAAGLPPSDDFNAERQEGVGLYQTTTRNRRRCSTATGYLRAARRTGLVTVLTGLRARRIVIESGVAVGVDVAAPGGVRRVVADREVLVTAGALGSPYLLLHSGVGDPTRLRGLGIEVTAEVPGVGRNLQDHYCYEVSTEVRKVGSYDRYNQLGWGALALARFALTGRGPLTSTVVEGGAFSRVGEEPDPALQFAFLPAARPVASAGVTGPAPGAGCGLLSWPSRPRSRGVVELASADPQAPPRVDPRYLSDAYDIEVGVAGIEQSREILSQAPMAAYDARECFPGAATTGREALLQSLREHGRTGYHLVGTCAMGDGDLSVVDPQLRVRGVAGLRVCDSSVMPQLVSSNTQATVVMIAERASDLVLDRA